MKGAEELTLDRAKEIYRVAVDANASDLESQAWWDAVHAEIVQVVAARSIGDAAQVIAWWHNDWSSVGDRPAAAARRIRGAARVRPTVPLARSGRAQEGG